MTSPFEFVIWSAQECADYLHQKRPDFLRSTRHAPSFPKELPTRPRHWQAMAVVQWALGNELTQQKSAEITQEAA
jgi:hypothetical protein